MVRWTHRGGHKFERKATPMYEKKVTCRIKVRSGWFFSIFDCRFCGRPSFRAEYRGRPDIIGLRFLGHRPFFWHTTADKKVCDFLKKLRAHET